MQTQWASQLNPLLRKSQGFLTSDDVEKTLIALSASYVMLNDDGIGGILMTTGSSNQTVTLPLAKNNPYRTILLKKADAGAGFAVLSVSGSDTIAGGSYTGTTSTKTMRSTMETVIVQSDGINTWHVTGEIVNENYLVSLAAASPTSLVSGTAKTVISQAIGSGLWVVGAVAQYRPAGTTSVSDIDTSISTTNNALAGSASRGSPDAAGQVELERASAAYVPGGPIDQSISPYRVLVTANTTYYLVVQAFFSVSTMTANGYLSLRKVGFYA